MSPQHALLFGALLVPCLCHGQDLPLATPEPALQAELARVVDALASKHGVPASQLAVSLVDMTHGTASAGVGADRQVYAASLPKIAILYGAFSAMERGTLPDTPKLRAAMTAMIRRSSNRAATAVLHQVGFEQLWESLRTEPAALYDWDPATRTGLGGLWVGKAYGKGGRRVGDPKANTSHGATARQAARFFALVQQEKLVSPEASRDMKEILGDPAIKHKFVKGLAAHRPGGKIYRKSGTWRTFHADGAIIEQPARDGVPAYTYVLVGLVDHANGSKLLEDLVGRLDDVVRARAVARAKPRSEALRGARGALEAAFGD